MSDSDTIDFKVDDLIPMKLDKIGYEYEVLYQKD